MHQTKTFQTSCSLVCGLYWQTEPPRSCCKGLNSFSAALSCPCAWKMKKKNPVYLKLILCAVMSVSYRYTSCSGTTPHPHSINTQTCPSCDKNQSKIQDRKNTRVCLVTWADAEVHVQTASYSGSAGVPRSCTPCQVSASSLYNLNMSYFTGTNNLEQGCPNSDPCWNLQMPVGSRHEIYNMLPQAFSKTVNVLFIFFVIG